MHMGERITFYSYMGMYDTVQHKNFISFVSLTCLMESPNFRGQIAIEHTLASV